LLPRRLTEDLVPVLRIDDEVLVFRDAWLPDQRFRQPVPVLHVVEAVAPLDAETAGIRWSIQALHEQNPVVRNVVGEQAPDTAVGTDRVDRFFRYHVGHVARRHERAGRAGLDALAAGDAGGIAHRIVEVEDDLRVVAAERVSDHVVHLHFAAGADAALALDAGIQVHGHRGVREILDRLRTRTEPGLADAQLLRPAIQFRVPRVGRLGNISQQQLERHLLAGEGAGAVGRDLHA